MLWTFRYQAQLQKNLLYLAAIADAQPPQNPTSRPQVSLCTQLSILQTDGATCGAQLFILQTDGAAW